MLLVCVTFLRALWSFMPRGDGGAVYTVNHTRPRYARPRYAT